MAEQGEMMAGRCLCGQAAFTAAPVRMEMDACHCSMCRRWAGGVGLIVDVSALRFEDESRVGVYASSPWGERLFCRTCGASLAWRLAGGGYMNVAAAAFDEAERFAFTGEIFIDDKPAAYAFANETHKLTGAQVAAKVAAQLQSRANENADG